MNALYTGGVMDLFSEKEYDAAKSSEAAGTTTENDVDAVASERPTEQFPEEPAVCGELYKDLECENDCEKENCRDDATELPLSAESFSESIPAEEPTDDKPEKKSSSLGFIYDTVELVAISLVLVMVILTVFVRHSPVNGSSMYPTILGRSEGSSAETVGKDVLLISNFLYTPKKGDIVVVQTPYIKAGVADSLGHPIVKRIIATEHDRVSIDFENWRIVINGEIYEDGLHSVPYVFYDNATLVNGVPSKQMYGFYPQIIQEMREDSRCNFEQEGAICSFTVPEGQVFILGDNRNNSKDSRAIGFIDERWIIGKSLLRVYPFDRFGVVE
jgi:signal peptidase I